MGVRIEPQTIETAFEFAERYVDTVSVDVNIGHGFGTSFPNGDMSDVLQDAAVVNNGWDGLDPEVQRQVALILGAAAGIHAERCGVEIPERLSRLAERISVISLGETLDRG